MDTSRRIRGARFSRQFFALLAVFSLQIYHAVCSEIRSNSGSWNSNSEEENSNSAPQRKLLECSVLQKTAGNCCKRLFEPGAKWDITGYNFDTSKTQATWEVKTWDTESAMSIKNVGPVNVGWTTGTDGDGNAIHTTTVPYDYLEGQYDPTTYSAITTLRHALVNDTRTCSLNTNAAVKPMRSFALATLTNQRRVTVHFEPSARGEVGFDSFSLYVDKDATQRTRMSEAFNGWFSKSTDPRFNGCLSGWWSCDTCPKTWNSGTTSVVWEAGSGEHTIYYEVDTLDGLYNTGESYFELKVSFQDDCNACTCNDPHVVAPVDPSYFIATQPPGSNAAYPPSVVNEAPWGPGEATAADLGNHFIEGNVKIQSVLPEVCRPVEQFTNVTGCTGQEAQLNGVSVVEANWYCRKTDCSQLYGYYFSGVCQAIFTALRVSTYDISWQSNTPSSGNIKQSIFDIQAKYESMTCEAPFTSPLNLTWSITLTGISFARRRRRRQLLGQMGEMDTTRIDEIPSLQQEPHGPELRRRLQGMPLAGHDVLPVRENEAAGISSSENEGKGSTWSWSGHFGSGGEFEEDDDEEFETVAERVESFDGGATWVAATRSSEEFSAGGATPEELTKLGWRTRYLEEEDEGSSGGGPEDNDDPYHPPRLKKPREDDPPVSPSDDPYHPPDGTRHGPGDSVDRGHVPGDPLGQHRVGRHQGSGEPEFIGGHGSAYGANGELGDSSAEGQGRRRPAPDDAFDDAGNFRRRQQAAAITSNTKPEEKTASHSGSTNRRNVFRHDLEPSSFDPRRLVEGATTGDHAITALKGDPARSEEGRQVQKSENDEKSTENSSEKNEIIERNGKKGRKTHRKRKRRKLLMTIDTVSVDFRVHAPTLTVGNFWNTNLNKLSTQQFFVKNVIVQILNMRDRTLFIDSTSYVINPAGASTNLASIITGSGTGGGGGSIIAGGGGDGLFTIPAIALPTLYLNIYHFLTAFIFMICICCCICYRHKKEEDRREAFTHEKGWYGKTSSDSSSVSTDYSGSSYEYYWTDDSGTRRSSETGSSSEFDSYSSGSSDGSSDESQYKNRKPRMSGENRHYSKERGTTRNRSKESKASMREHYSKNALPHVVADGLRRAGERSKKKSKGATPADSQSKSMGGQLKGDLKNRAYVGSWQIHHSSHDSPESRHKKEKQQHTGFGFGG